MVLLTIVPVLAPSAALAVVSKITPRKIVLRAEGSVPEVSAVARPCRASSHAFRQSHLVSSVHRLADTHVI
jgi:hypothetical protein